jgi:S-adenosylmethionine/arginine decarboxylase-like enzyme
MAAVHKHLIVRAEVNDPPVDESWAIQWISKLTKDIGMNILLGPFARYLDVPGNRGLTVATIIETSHIVMHVWDEDKPSMLQLDVYTCGPLDTEIIFNAINEFEPVHLEYKYLDREHSLIEVNI